MKFSSKKTERKKNRHAKQNFQCFFFFCFHDDRKEKIHASWKNNKTKSCSNYCFVSIRPDKQNWLHVVPYRYISLCRQTLFYCLLEYRIHCESSHRTLPPIGSKINQARRVFFTHLIRILRLTKIKFWFSINALVTSQASNVNAMTVFALQLITVRDKKIRFIKHRSTTILLNKIHKISPIFIKDLRIQRDENQVASNFPDKHFSNTIQNLCTSDDYVERDVHSRHPLQYSSVLKSNLNRVEWTNIVEPTEVEWLTRHHSINKIFVFVEPNFNETFVIVKNDFSCAARKRVRSLFTENMTNMTA